MQSARRRGDLRECGGPPVLSLEFREETTNFARFPDDWAKAAEVPEQADRETAG